MTVCNILAILSISLLALNGFAQVSVNFNTAGDLNANFNTSYSTNLWSELGSGGISGSGSLDIILGGAQVWTYKDPFVGNSISWSTSIYLVAWYVFNRTGSFSIGFTTDQTPTQVSLGNPSNSIGLTLTQFSAGADRIALYNSGSQVSSTSIVDLVSISPAYLYLNLSVDYIGSNQYDLTGTIYRTSSAGAIQSTLGTISTTVTNSALANDPQTYLYLGTNGNLNLRYADNFDATVSPIPEPSTTILLLGLTTLCATLLLRKAKRGKDMAA